MIPQSKKLEPLESRVLLAMRTVDFENYPVNFTQFDWMLQDVHTPSSGFSYTIGTGDGQRPNKNGITWADATYYETVLGAGGFNTVNNWGMQTPILYTQAGSVWLTQGWNYVPDMAEGATCIDDAARAAIAYIDDYLLNGTASSYQTARDILTFVAYMTTQQGKVYNFAWLDAPATFAWDPIFSQDAHFQYRVEYYRRTGYPSTNPDGSWFDPNSATSQIINWPSPVRASPFTAHPKYSVYIDDLRDATNNDVATVYNGPLYSAATGGPTSFKTNIKKTWTNSTQAFGFDESRAVMAVARGLMMMQKREAEVGGTLGAEELQYTKFLENLANRMIRNVQLQNPLGWDSKLASPILTALADYYQLYYGTTEYGTFSFKLASNSNTAQTNDDRPSQTSVMTSIDSIANMIKSRQVRTADWKNGIFSDDGTGNNWDAWGQLQIYALSRTYRMKVNVGQDPASVPVASLLDYAAYAADNFYGIEAYHYLVPGTNNVRTKERITSIVGGGAKYHTNSTQIAYHNTSLIAGLRELARAYEASDRADKTTRMATYLNGMKSVATWYIGNNTSLLDMYDGGGLITGTYRGRGQVYDGITPNGSAIPSINRNTGGESFDEGVWGMVLAQAAMRDYGLDSTFTFETGATFAAAPTVSASLFDFNASVPTVRFTFSQEVGASIHAFDINIINTTTSQTVPTSAMSLAYNPGTRRLDITFPGYVDGVLPDGDYVVTLPAGTIVGNSGNPMTTDHNFTFFALGGDANRDRAVNLDDFNILATNFGQSGKLFADGDFTYDGTVDLDDFNVLASRFGQGLGPAARPSSITTPGKSSAGAASSIADDVLGDEHDSIEQSIT